MITSSIVSSKGQILKITNHVLDFNSKTVSKQSLHRWELLSSHIYFYLSSFKNIQLFTKEYTIILKKKPINLTQIPNENENEQKIL